MQYFWLCILLSKKFPFPICSKSYEMSGVPGRLRKPQQFVNPSKRSTGLRFSQ